MTAFLLAALLACLTASARADDSVTLQEHPFQPGSYEVFDQGQRTGSVRERPFQPGEYEVFDRDGRKVGEISRDPFGEETDQDPQR